MEKTKLEKHREKRRNYKMKEFIDCCDASEKKGNKIGNIIYDDMDFYWIIDEPVNCDCYRVVPFWFHQIVIGILKKIKRDLLHFYGILNMKFRHRFVYPKFYKYIDSKKKK